MRAALLALLCLPSLAGAQAIFPAREVVRALGGTGVPDVLPPGVQSRPTAATGFPVPAETAPLPEPQESLSELRILRGQITRKRGGRLLTLGSTAEGEERAELTYRGYRIFADRIDANLDTSVFKARGDVRLVGKSASVTGDEVDFDFKNEVYAARRARSRIGRELTGGQLRGDLFVRGGSSSGTRRRFTIETGALTTCDRPDPHYSLDARVGTVRPNREARLKGVALRVLGRTVLRLGSLYVPLAERDYDYLPQVGESPDEGYFVKNRYGFPIGPTEGGSRGEVRLDEMTKLGTGLGLGYGYRSALATGIVRGYGIAGAAGTLNLQNEHRQIFSFGRVSIQNDFQRSNYLTAPGATLLNSRIEFDLTQRPGATTTLGFVRNSNASSGFSTENGTLSLADARSYGPRTRTDVKLDYSSASSRTTAVENGDSRRQTVDVRLRGSQDLKKATATLDYQRTVPIGAIENFFGGSDRTPVLTLGSDARRLVGERFDRVLPFTTELSLGEYGDPLGGSAGGGSRITRSGFLVDARRPSQSVGPWRFDLDGRFRQTAYSDDTAQYTLGTGAAIGYRVGKRLELNARYTYLRPYGYAPLLIDRTGTTNIATFDASAEPIRNLRIGAQTGFDLVRLQRSDVGWQQVGLRTEYGLGKTLLLRALATYDTFQEVWSSVRLDGQLVRGDLNVSLGARYDGVRHTFGTVNLFLDGLTIGRTRLATILAFNGYRGRLDSTQINAIYDLHCAEAVVTYSDFGTGFRSGREIRVFLRIKALPFDGNFGLGRRGQPLGTATGRDF